MEDEQNTTDSHCKRTIYIKNQKTYARRNMDVKNLMVFWQAKA
jgi:hypothetical protein